MVIMNFIKPFFIGIVGMFVVSPVWAFLDEPFEIERFSDRYGPVDDDYYDIIMSKNLAPQSPTDLRSQDDRYKGPSAIYGAGYPKLTMVHTYNHLPYNNYLSAAIPQEQLSQEILDILRDHLPGHRVTISFNVQEANPDSTAPNTPLALRPHYGVHPDAPMIPAGEDYGTAIRWTVIPGAEGQIEPAEGNLQNSGLHGVAISTHAHIDALGDPMMVVSPDGLHLQGFEIIEQQGDHGPKHHLSKNYAFFSIVAFRDERGEDLAALTYHWLLTSKDGGKDRDDFCNIRNNANTLRELIEGRAGVFGGLDAKESFRHMVDELKEFVNFSPRQQDARESVPQNQPFPQEPIAAPVLQMVQPIPQDPIASVPQNQPIPHDPIATVPQNQPLPQEPIAAPVLQVVQPIPQDPIVSAKVVTTKKQKTKTKSVKPTRASVHSKTKSKRVKIPRASVRSKTKTKPVRIPRASAHSKTKTKTKTIISRKISPKVRRTNAVTKSRKKRVR